MRLLLISYFFPPDKSVGGLRAASITKYFPNSGIEVVLLTSQTDLEETKGIQEQFNVKELFTAKKSKLRYWGYKTKILALLELLNLDKLFVFPDIYFPWIRRAVKEGRKAIKQTNPDCILVTAPPFSSFIVANKLSLEFNLPLLLDYRDPWSGNPTIKYPLEIVHKRHYKMEKKIIQRADLVVTVSEDCAEVISSNIDFPLEKIDVIYNGYTSVFEDKKNVQKTKKLKIFYSGSIHSIYKKTFDNFLYALNALICEKNLTPEDICFAYAGDTSRKTIYKKLEQFNIVPFFEDLGYLQGDEYYEQLQGSNLHLVFNPEIHKYALVTKIYDYMQVDSHFLIIGKQGAVVKICKEVKQQYTYVNDEKPENVVIMLTSLYEKWKDNKLAYGAQKEFVGNYSREEQAKRYANLITKQYM